MIPEVGYPPFDLSSRKLLLYPQVEALALLRFQIPVARRRVEELENGGGLESGAERAPQPGTPFPGEVRCADAVGELRPEPTVIIHPRSRGNK